MHDTDGNLHKQRTYEKKAVIEYTAVAKNSMEILLRLCESVCADFFPSY